MISNREDSLKIDRQLGLILILALLLRITDLLIPPHFSQPDEMFSFIVSTQDSISETIRRVIADTHPPLYFLILRYWLKITPSTLFSAKILSILFNVTNILITYYFCQIWLDKKTAKWVALLMAVSPWNVYWAHHARNHQMLPPLFTLSSWSLLSWIRSEKKGFPFAFFLCTALMVHTNYLAFFILATQGLIALWECRRKIGRLIPLGIAAVLALLTYLPYKQFLLYHLHHGPMNAPEFQHTVSPGLLYFHFIFFNLFTTDLADLWYPPPNSLGIILLGGLIISGILIMAPKRIKNISFYMLMILPPTLTLVYAKLGQTTMAERYLAYTIGPFCIAFAAGLRGAIERLKFRKREV